MKKEETKTKRQCPLSSVQVQGPWRQSGRRNKSGGRNLWKRWVLSLEWKTKGVIDGNSEVGDCDEVICAGWGEPGGEWTEWSWWNEELSWVMLFASQGPGWRPATNAFLYILNAERQWRKDHLKWQKVTIIARRQFLCQCIMKCMVQSYTWFCTNHMNGPGSEWGFEFWPPPLPSQKNFRWPRHWQLA